MSFAVGDAVTLPSGALVITPPVSITPASAFATPVPLPVLTVSADGQRVWVGEGPPTVVPGSSPNDLYLDELDGTLYRLA